MAEISALGSHIQADSYYLDMENDIESDPLRDGRWLSEEILAGILMGNLAGIGQCRPVSEIVLLS